MKIYEYDNYEHYVQEQTKANIRKLGWVYVTERSIDNIKSLQPEANAIICHGTRNGAEQKMFQQRYPNAEIIGTEISETATQFPMTVQWDFTNQKDEWVGKFDIVYSNAFDHSMDPEATLKTWVDQMSPEGCLFIEHSESPINNVSSAADPLEISHRELELMFTRFGLIIFNRTPGKRSESIVFGMRKK